MKLFEFYESSPSYVDDELTSYVNMGEWYEKAVKEYREKGLEALFQYISRTKSGKLAGKDIQTIKHDFESDRDQYETEEEAVAEFLDFLNSIPEGKDKPKQNNPVAKHSRNMAGAGAHKSPKDYDRKDKKKDIKKELEEGEERSDIRDLMIVKVKDYLQTKSPGSYISLEDLESDLYDYASQLDHDDLDSPEELRNFMHNPGEEASSAVTELLSGMYHSEFDDYITADDDYVDNRNMGNPDGYSSSEEDQPDRIREESDKMIGKPDGFYDAQERQEAYNDLQDALQGNYMDDYIKDGDCPSCGGSGYMDGEETYTNDDGEEEEGSECDGFGNYGCDQGQMTYSDDEPSWVQIFKHDKRQADRKEQLANRPSDEELIPKIANMMKNMEDPRMAVRQVRIDYGYGPAKASDIVGKAMALLKQDEGLEFDEGTRCWKGYEKKGTKKMYGKTVPNCVKKESIEEGMPTDGYYLAHRAKKLWLDDNPGKTERDYWQVGVKVQDDYTEKAGGIKGDYQGKGVSNWTTEGVFDKHSDHPVAPGGQSSARKPVPVINQIISLDDVKFKVTNISKDSKTFDIVNVKDPKEIHRGIKVDSNPFFIEGKSPHKKGTTKYKKHMAAMHAEDVGTDSSEADVSKMLAKALGDPNRWQEMTAPELYAELESRDTEFADAIKQVAKIVYGVKLEETITTISK